jgi:hypothetical protein
MAAELNARIGRTLPSPMFGVLVDACGPAASTTPPIAPRLSRVGWLLAALLAALWPHWIYMTRRTFDGSDEPWGVLALVTVFVLLTRERRGLAVPCLRSRPRSGCFGCRRSPLQPSACSRSACSLATRCRSALARR